MWQYHPSDSRLWLRDQLYAESLEVGETPPDVRDRIRTVHLSELEALALMLLAFDIEAMSKADGYTHDIAHHLTTILLSRLDALL
jgi:hypothetical protein